MKKKSLEIVMSIASVAIFIILIVLVRLIMPAYAGYGFTAALLIFALIMGISGLKLAEIPESTD